MAMETVKMDRYVCDSCGKAVLSPHNDITEAFGYHGTAFEISETHGSPSAKWFACSIMCVSNAVTVAISNANG